MVGFFALTLKKTFNILNPTPASWLLSTEIQAEEKQSQEPKNHREYSHGQSRFPPVLEKRHKHQNCAY